LQKQVKIKTCGHRHDETTMGSKIPAKKPFIGYWKEKVNRKRTERPVSVAAGNKTSGDQKKNTLVKKK